MNRFPFLSLTQSLVLLRVSVAAMFIAHAVVRVKGGTVEQFGAFLGSKGLPEGTAIVWALTAFEILGGAALALGLFTRWLALGFIAMLAVGIGLIHAGNGWFVGEHGTGGVEYSFVLMIALVVIAAAAEGKPRSGFKATWPKIK